LDRKKGSCEGERGEGRMRGEKEEGEHGLK
jgi:hypothetical protein